MLPEWRTRQAAQKRTSHTGGGANASVSALTMNESESLDALANVLNVIAERPYDVSVHAQHIRLAQSLPGMDAEVLSAMEMMTQFLAAGDEVWLPLLQNKEESADLETEQGVEELLALYARAESDYLCESF